jgi:hypothetical protein
MRQRAGIAAVALLASLTVACGPTTGMEGVLGLPLEGGGDIASIVSARDSAVVVVVDPGEAFNCMTALAAWREWGRSRPERFTLVFTRPPSTVEQRNLRLLRLQSDAVLQRPPNPFPVGRELLVKEGKVLLSSRMIPGRIDSAVRMAVARHDAIW